MRTYDLAGRLTGTVPSAVSVARGFAYSPDGALVLLAELDLRHGPKTSDVIVLDAATGAQRNRLSLPLAVLTPTLEGIVGWYDARHLAVYSVTLDQGKQPQASLRVVDLAGKTSSTVDVPYQPDMSEKILGTVRR